jgi:two-component sensor histidine kinase
MAATTTVQIGADRRATPRWMLGRTTARRFAGIVLLAVCGFVASVIVLSRTLDARDWVQHSREVQLQIDRIVWDLMKLQQATQAHALDPGLDATASFAQLRGDVHGDLAETARITADNAYQQQRIGNLGAAFDRYMANLEMTIARGAQHDLDRSRALAMTADVTRVSALVTEMRNNEDGLLTERIRRADAFFAVLLPTLSFSVAVIAYLVVFVGRAIAQALRQGEIVLSEKDGELAAKDIMMREVDHRMRNSLNLIHNLMLLQQRRTPEDSVARGLLKEAANQILVVARVHERLYKYGSMQAVELGEYLQHLCSDVASIALPAEAQTAIQLNAGRAEVRAEEAIWLGLIVVELITNALKYGNPSPQSPITIDVSPDETQLRLTVADNGAGMPPGFDFKSGKGLGMQVVLLLVRQLHATLEVDPDWNGSRFIVTVPLPART